MGPPESERGFEPEGRDDRLGLPRSRAGIEAPGPESPTVGARLSERLSLARYREPVALRSSLQVVTSLAAFSVTWLLAWASLRISYALTLLFALVAAGFVIRLFALQHDCGHGSLFKSRLLNDVCGGLFSVITMTPYYCWRRYHSMHHATSGDLGRRGFGDLRLLTVREYARLGRLQRWAYRGYHHPLVLFGIGPFLYFVVWQRFAHYVPREWRLERLSVHATNVAIAGCYVGVGWLVGWRDFLLVQVPVMVLAGSAGVWLIHVQHLFEGTYWRSHAEWDHLAASLEGSSYYDLPPLLRWLTASMGLHHVHHLDSRIPNYRLKECLDDNPELMRVTRLTLRSSLACAALKLWDEDQQRLVGFAPPMPSNRAWDPVERKGG